MYKASKKFTLVFQNCRHVYSGRKLQELRCFCLKYFLFYYKSCICRNRTKMLTNWYLLQTIKNVKRIQKRYWILFHILYQYLRWMRSLDFNIHTHQNMHWIENVKKNIFKLQSNNYVFATSLILVCVMDVRYQCAARGPSASTFLLD